MGRILSIFILVLTLNSENIFADSGSVTKISILALLKNTKLDSHPTLKEYYDRTMDLCQKMDRFDYWFDYHLNNMSLTKIRDEKYIINTLIEDASKEDLAFLNLALIELKIDNNFIKKNISNLLSKAENVNKTPKYILNTSSDKRHKITLPNKISFRNIILSPGHTEKLLINIRSKNYGGKIYAFTEHDPKYVDTYKHCIRMLMRDFKIDDHSARIEKWNDELIRDISPLDLYMRLRSQSGQTRHFYYGDFSQSGAIRSWGNFILFYESLETKMLEGRKKRCYLPVTDIDVLRDLLIAEGIQLITKINFIGIEKISDLRNTENKNCKASELFQNAITSIKDSKILLKKMNEVLTINKNHLSAALVKEVLQKKIPPRMSLKSSFEVFQQYYYHLRKKYDLKWISNKVSSDQTGRNHREILAFVKEVKKYASKTDPSMITAYKGLLGCTESCFEIFESIRKKKPVNPGVIKKYYSQVRNINYSWNLILDNQRHLDGIFK